MNSTNTLSVAVAQSLVIPGDIHGNLARMEPLIMQAARQGARLVLFSECALNGYDHQGIGAASAIAADDPVIKRLRTLATTTHQALVVGFYERVQQQIFNSAAIALPDGRLLVQRKHLVTPIEIRTGHVQSGARERIIFEVGGFHFAILICADVGIVGIHEQLSSTGCDAILAPTAGLGSDDHAFFQAQLQNEHKLAEYLRAAESVCFISPATFLKYDMALICCNQMGYSQQHRFFHCGHSAIIDRTGETTALIPGRFVVEHLRPQLALGFISSRSVTSNAM